MAAKKQTKYEDYWPKKKETRLIQAQVDIELHGLVKDDLDKRGLTWHQFIEGLMKKYIADEKLK